MRPQRVSLQVPVRYRAIGEGAWHQGRTENISRTGVLIRAARVVPVGAEVDVILTVPTGIMAEMAAEIICDGAVARHVPVIAGGSPGIGVLFRKCRPTAASRGR
jgi:hypothetical protein